MALNSFSFAEKYSQMSDDELLGIEADRRSLVLEAKEALEQELKKRNIAVSDSGATAAPAEPQSSGRSEVVITDISMPFLSMVSFMVKWALASIPALAILTIIAFLAWLFFLAAFAHAH
jgi:hypothetical protein